MSSTPTSRRAVAEIDFSGNASGLKIGNRTIHGFWHLFSSHFRHVLVAPQRRPDSGRVAWTWNEVTLKRPATAAELAEVRRRLSEAGRSLAGSLGGGGREDSGPRGGGATLEGQVLAIVNEMVGQLVAQRDYALARFVCRTETGLMVHSWGSPVAAEPHYPDGQSGEISGTVYGPDGRPLAARVVLENFKDVRVAGVESHKNGGFKFKDIPAGSYRLRVADRVDFPPEGILVTLDQDSMTGLELRALDAPTSSGKAAERSASPWYRRPGPLAALALLFLGAGAVAWLVYAPSGVNDSAGKASGEWQAANGALVDSGGHDKDTEHRGLHKGLEWPSLSKLAKALKSQFSREPKAAAASGGDADRPQPDAKDSANPPGTDREDRPVTEPREQKPAKPEKQEARTEKERGAREKGDAPMPAEKESSESSTLPSDKAQQDAKAANDSSSADAPSPSAPPAKETIRRVAAAAARSDGPSANATAAASPSVGPAPDAASPGPDAGGDGASTIAASAAGGSSDGRSDAGRGQAAGGQAGPAAAASAAVAPTSTSEIIMAVDSAEDATSKKPGTAKATAPAAPMKTSPSPGAVQPLLAAQSHPDAPADPEAKESIPSEKPQTPRAVSAADGVLKPREKPAENPEASARQAPDSSDPSPSKTDSPKAAEYASRPSDGPGTPNRKPGSPDPGQSVDSAQASAEAPLALDPIRPAEPDAMKNPPLVRIGRVHTSPWKAQVVQDLILPTQPMPVSSGESVEAMREELRKERLALMPSSFRRPKAQSGFSFEFPANPSDSPEWHDAGAPAAGATVRGNRAEIAYSPAEAPRGHTYVLSTREGREIARVSFDKSGTPAVSISFGTRAWYWLGIERAPADRPFDLQLLSGRPVPAAWTRDDHWLGGSGQRIDFPLDPSAAVGGSTSIAFVDRSTGLGIACAFTVR